MDESSLIEWENLKKGSVIIFKDIRNLHENINGIPLTISKIERFCSDLFEYLIFNFDEKPNSILVVKKVIDLFEIRFYSEVEWIGKGSRSDLIKNDNKFLFDAPDKPRGFIPKDLNYTNQIILIDDHLGEIVFNIKNQGTVWGKWIDKDCHCYFAGVVEYHSESLTSDPEFLITEIGGEESEDGGWVVVWEGYGVESGDLEVLSKK